MNMNCQLVCEITEKWRIKLYHFTDIANIPSIHENGLLPKRCLEERGIRFNPVSNEWSQCADQRNSLDCYVHLCFKNQHQMAYARRHQGCNIVFLEISTDVLYYDGVLFTNDVSNKHGVIPFSIDEFENNIDCDVLFGTTNWFDPSIQNRLQNAEKSEVLIPTVIPTNKIIFPS